MKLLIGLNSRAVRNMCIEHDYYTKGDNEQYGTMLRMCSKDMTEERLVKIAEDIKSHSDTNDDVRDIIYSLSELLKVVPYFR